MKLEEEGCFNGNPSDLLFQNPQLTRVASDIAPLALPSIRLITTRTPEEMLPLGVSKLGGLPDLPSAADWPTWNGIPLAFVAQINLVDIQKFKGAGVLPAAGLLSFFYDADHVPVGYDPSWKGGWRVLFFRDLTALRRVSVPTPLLERSPTWMPPGQHYAPCALTFRGELTFPPATSSSIQALHLSDQEQKAYWHVLDQMEAGGREPIHRLLGHPDALQGDMQQECQLVSHGLHLGDGWPKEAALAEQLQGGSKDWQLLLQLDSDPEPQMVWGIEGRSYYWTQTQALEACHFEDTWFIMQWT